MHFVIAPGVDDDLAHADDGGEEGVVSEEHIVEVDVAGFGFADEVALSVVDGVEHEAGEVHGHEVKVHSLHADSGGKYLLFLKFS